MGSFACSSSDGARPSQNCVALNIAFSTVGLLRCGRWAGAATPSGTGLWSTRPRAGSWQVAHDTWTLIVRRLSLNSLSPSASLFAVGAGAGAVQLPAREAPAGAGGTRGLGPAEPCAADIVDALLAAVRQRLRGLHAVGDGVGRSPETVRHPARQDAGGRIRVLTEAGETLR